RGGAHRCLAGAAFRDVAVGVDPPLTPARRSLQSMTYLLALLGALVGAAFGITSFEGASGYFSIFIGGPIGALVGLVLGAVLVLRRGGQRSAGAMAGGVAFVLVGAIGLAAAGLGAFWLMRPLTNAN